MPSLLSKEFLAIRARIGTAAAKSQGLSDCLVRSQCIDIARELQEVSSKCMATMEGDTCSDQVIQEEVAAVDLALDKIRRYCTERNIGNRMFESIWQEDGARTVDFMVMLYYDTEEPSVLQDAIAYSMIAIHGAAAQALQELEQDGYKGHH